MRLPVVDLANREALSALDAVLLGVPYDGGTSYRPGARLAPRAVRESSSLIRGFTPALNGDVFSQLEVADAGDVDVGPFDVIRALDSIESVLGSIASSCATPLIIGGDHTISLPALRTLYKRYGTLALVHFDAHSDTYGPAYGSDYHHGTPFRHAIVEGLVDPARFIQIGIRGQFSSATDLDFAKDAGVTIVTAEDVHDHGVDAIVAQIDDVVEAGAVYLSFDIDCVDPAFAPGTGTPVPGGLTSAQALAFLRKLAHLNLCGADVVEVSPPYDPTGITSLLAAHLLYGLLAILSSRKVKA